MIEPKENETAQEYTVRFMTDPEAVAAYSSPHDRKAVSIYRYSKHQAKNKKPEGSKHGK